MATLDCSETRRTLRAGFGVADFISASFADAKFPTVRWFRMVAFPLDNRDACAAAPRAFAPCAPFTPSPVNLTRSINDWNALLVLTPLWQCSKSLLNASVVYRHVYEYLIFETIFREYRAMARGKNTNLVT